MFMFCSGGARNLSHEKIYLFVEENPMRKFVCEEKSNEKGEFIDRSSFLFIIPNSVQN